MKLKKNEIVELNKKNPVLLANPPTSTPKD